MKLLEERICEEGYVLQGDILKVDSFLNHQIDPELFQAMGKDMKAHFAACGITKVLTLEVSGIAIAYAAALELGVKVVFAKKTESLTLAEQVYSSRVSSYTKGKTYEIRVDKRFLDASDRVLLIDDFLANGQALKGMIALCEQAGATVAGIGIAIEKTFQPGGRELRAQGYEIYSQARISSLANGRICFENT